MDIALQIKHIALFTTPLENNIPTHQKYATYTTYGNPTPLFRWSAIRRCDGCLIEVHIRHLHCFYTVCTVVRRASESNERCTGGAANACTVRKNDADNINDEYKAGSAQTSLPIPRRSCRKSRHATTASLVAFIVLGLWHTLHPNTNWLFSSRGLLCIAS